MPELPEVETIRLGLEPLLLNQIITEAMCHRPGLRYPFPEDFANRLVGSRVTRMIRRAKYILCYLQKEDHQDVWMCHLGMTGRFSVIRPGQQRVPLAKHDHLHLKCANGIEIRYHDSRRFGFMKLFPESQLATESHLAKLGWEPLGNDLSLKGVWHKLRMSSRCLKQLLMDQSLIAGLGNIYVSEVLFRSQLHPDMIGSELSLADVERLIAMIRLTLREALVAGGSSLKSFQQVSGQSGYFQMHFQVYGRQGKECLRPGCRGQIIRVQHHGRATFFCPICQKQTSDIDTGQRQPECFESV